MLEEQCPRASIHQGLIISAALALSWKAGTVSHTVLIVSGARRGNRMMMRPAASRRYLLGFESRLYCSRRRGSGVATICTGMSGTTVRRSQMRTEVLKYAARLERVYRTQVMNTRVVECLVHVCPGHSRQRRYQIRKLAFF